MNAPKRTPVSRLPADGVRWIREPEQLQALASSMRQNLMDRLEALGPSTVAQLAESLGVAADGLYYHLKKLEDVGLVRRADVAKGAGRDGVTWDLAARRWHLAYEPGNPDNESALTDITANLLRQAQRDFERGFGVDGVQVEGALRSLWSLRLEASLSDDELRGINRHLQGILAILRKPQRRAEQPLYALTWVLAPLPPRRGGPAAPAETEE